MQRMERVKMEVTDFHSYQARIFFFFPPPHLSPRCVTCTCSLVVGRENHWYWRDDSSQQEGYGDAVSTSPLPAHGLAAPQGLPFLLPFNKQCLSHTSRVLPWCLPMAHVHWDEFSSLS